MKEAAAKMLFEAASDADLEVEIREDYSGRGMYGKTTFAVVVDDVMDLLAATIKYAAEVGYDVGYAVAIEEATKGSLGDDKFEAPDFRNLRTDSMGMRVVVY